MHPDDVVIRLVSVAKESPVGAQISQWGGFHVSTPALGATVIANISRRQYDEDAFLGRFTDHPVGVLKISFVRLAEVTGGQKWIFTIPVIGAAEFMFDQFDNDRIETAVASVFQVDFGFCLGQADDQ